MKRTVRILPILITCLTIVPLTALSDQPGYPELFRSLSIPQLPSSKVIEVKIENKLPVSVVLDSDDKWSVSDAELYYSGDSKPFSDVWYYDYDATDEIDRETGAVNILRVHNIDGRYLHIRITPRGKTGCTVELTYPWVDPNALWFLKALDQGVGEQ